MTWPVLCLALACWAAENARGTQLAGAGADTLEVVDFRDVPLHQAMKLLAEQAGLNIAVSAGAGKDKLDLYLKNVKPALVFQILEKTNRYWIEEKDGVIFVLSKQERVEQEKRQLAESVRLEKRQLEEEKRKRDEAEREAKRQIDELVRMNKQRVDEEKARRARDLLAATSLKKIVVKGFVLGDEKRGMAVLEIDGKLVTVREKATFVNNAGIEFRLVVINDDGPRIEVLRQGID